MASLTMVIGPKDEPRVCTHARGRVAWAYVQLAGGGIHFEDCDAANAAAARRLAAALVGAAEYMERHVAAAEAPCA